jgi:hypothetical protein
VGAQQIIHNWLTKSASKENTVGLERAGLTGQRDTDVVPGTGIGTKTGIRMGIGIGIRTSIGTITGIRAEEGEKAERAPEDIPLAPMARVST